MMMPNDDDDGSEESGRKGKSSQGIALRKRTHQDVLVDVGDPDSKRPEKRIAESDPLTMSPTGGMSQTIPRDSEMKQDQESLLRSVNQNPHLQRVADIERLIIAGALDGSAQTTTTNLISRLPAATAAASLSLRNQPGVPAQPSTGAPLLGSNLFLRETAPAATLSHLLQLQQAQAMGLLPNMNNPLLAGTNSSILSGLGSSPTPLLQQDTLQALQQQRLLSILRGTTGVNFIQHLDQRQSSQDFLSIATQQRLQAVQSMPVAASPNPLASHASLPLQGGPDLSRQHHGFSLLLLAQPGDEAKLSPHQVFLRHQIEAFRAGAEEASTHARGRNKPITVGQVGIRCRHCAHLPIGRRQKGSTYFPATLQGIYQAAQNMCTTHMQCGLCSEMADEIKNEFARLLATKISSSGAGRPYWAESAKRLGLVDTDEGIRFRDDLPAGKLAVGTDK